jgi:hypothetical protein
MRSPACRRSIRWSFCTMSDKQSCSGDRNIGMSGWAAAQVPDVHKITEALTAERPNLIPLDLNQLSKVVKTIQDFWLTVVRLSSKF